MSGKYIEEDKTITCSVSNDCGGCCYTKVPYDKTLSLKQKHVTELFRGVAECEKITGMYRQVNVIAIKFMLQLEPTGTAE